MYQPNTRDRFWLRYMSIFIAISQAHAINYALYRNDTPPSLESVASKVPSLEHILQEQLNSPSSSLQQDTERLLQYAGLVRSELLLTLGSEVYSDEDLTLSELTALNEIYQRTLERKYNLLLIVPFTNTTLQHFCSLIDDESLSSSAQVCEKIPREIHLTFPTAPAPVKLSLSSILTDLKDKKLELSSNLFLGLLLHVPFNNYDARTHNSLRHLIYSLLKNSDLKIGTMEHQNYTGIVDLVRDILTSGITGEAIPHAQYLSEQLEELIPLNSNIVALGAILENDRINLKYLFDAVLPNDTLDRDLIDAKNYLRHKLEGVKDWNINKVVGTEKYEYLKQDELLIGLLDKLIDIDFVKDIASALKIDAYFWHKSHMIENLNDLLDLFDNYNNLRGVSNYRELMKTINRIKYNLMNSNNVTIELMCTRPRACLREGLFKIRQCRGINQETKMLINNFLEQSKDCSECIMPCHENPEDHVVASGSKETLEKSENECDNSEECEEDEVMSTLGESDKMKRIKKMRINALEEETSTERLGTTEDSLGLFTVEGTTEHVELPTEVQKIEEITKHFTTEQITEHPTTEEIRTEHPTTERITEPPTTEKITEPPTTERITEPPTTERITEPPTTERITEPPTTERITEPPTTERITEPPTTERITVHPTTERITEPPTTERITLHPTTERITVHPIEWVEIPLKEITEKPGIVVNLHKDEIIDTTLSATTESAVRTSVKMMPTIPDIHLKIEEPSTTESSHTVATTQKPRKRVICHHRDLYHRKKLRKLNKYRKHVKHEKKIGKPHLNLHTTPESGNINVHSHSNSGDLDLHLQSDSGKMNLQSTASMTTLHPSGKATTHSHSGKVEVHIGDAGSHSKAKAESQSNSNGKVDVHLHSHSGELGLHSHSDSGKIDLHSHSNSGEVGVHSHSDSGKVDLHSHSKSGELGVHSHTDSGKVDLQSHSKSGELGLHSHSGSGKVDLLSHSDSGKVDLHSHSQSNSSELGVHSHSDSDSGRVNLHSESDSGEKVSVSTETAHSSILEKTYHMATKGEEKLKAGIGKLNPFSRRHKNTNANSNTNINQNSRRSKLGGKIFDSSEESLSRNSDSSDTSDLDLGLADEQEHKYYENMKKKKKSKEFSKYKDSESSHKSHKKMTSYYNEEFQEEKYKKHKSNSVRTHKSQSRRADKKDKTEEQLGNGHKLVDHQDHLGNSSKNSTADMKKRMLDLDMTKFFNFEVKRDENVQTKARRDRREVVGEGQPDLDVVGRQFLRLAKVAKREAPKSQASEDLKQRMLDVKVPKFFNIEFKRDENLTEVRKK